MPRSSATVPFAPTRTRVWLLRLALPGALALTLTLALALGVWSGSGVHGKPGAAGARDPYFPRLGNGGYDVKHYALTLSYDPETRHLVGTAEITARATQNLSAFNLDLKGLDVAGVTVEGKGARFDRAGQELTVRPHTNLAEGETFRTTVRYSGSPKTLIDSDAAEEGWLYTADGALALGEPTGSMAWFPGNHHPSDKAAYDIAVTVPKGLRAVSNGELKSETTAADGRRTFTWHTGEPMASYLATVAIGKYDVTRSTTKNGLPVYIAVDPTQTAAAKKVLAKIPEVLDWAEYNFGPYPFSSTGAIVDRDEDSGYALETQSRPVFPGAPDTTLLIHELAHEWFGDSVSPKSWQDMWLNEGFATYAEWLWQEDHDGDTAEEIFNSLYKGDYYGDPEVDERIWDFPPAKPSGPTHLSDLPVYDRGAMVLHKIRQTVGDDTFYDIIQGWAATHRHGNASTADFTAYVEKKAPDKDFGGIWKDWLYGEGKPAHL